MGTGKLHYGAVAILLIGVFAVYSPLLGHEFLTYDDPLYITDNPNVAAGLTPSGVAWAFSTFRAGNWHPLTWLSHQLDVSLFGLRPAGHHFVNMLLHAGNTLLLYLLLRGLTGTIGRSMAAASLFGVHPVTVEPVAWAAERKEVLALFLGLAALLAWLGWMRRSGLHRYLAALGLFALGLMAKPMLVSLPFLMILLLFWPLPGANQAERGSLRPKILATVPFVLMSGAAGLVTLVSQGSAGAMSSLEGHPLGNRLVNVVLGYSRYLVKLIWPADLAPFYPMSRAAVPGWVIATLLLLLLTTSVAVTRVRRSTPYLAVGWLWYLVAMVPVIGIVQVGAQSMADRYLYLPMIGLDVIAVWGGAGLLRRLLPRGGRLAAPVLAAGGIAALAVCTVLQLRHWRDSESLYRHALAVTKGNHVAEHNLANLLLKRGDTAGAIEHYRRALQAEPDDPLYNFNYGWALEQAGRTVDAVKYYKQAVTVNPRMVGAHNNLGIIFAGQGRFEEAIHHFEQTVAIDPGNIAFRRNLELARTKYSGAAQRPPVGIKRD